MSVINQGQYALWSYPELSDAQILLTAEYRMNADEGHYGPHRNLISAYILKASSILDNPYYFLEDQYLTARKYDLGAKADALASEKTNILSRLRRVALERRKPR